MGYFKIEPHNLGENVIVIFQKNCDNYLKCDLKRKLRFAVPVCRAAQFGQN